MELLPCNLNQLSLVKCFSLFKTALKNEGLLDLHDILIEFLD